MNMLITREMKQLASTLGARLHRKDGIEYLRYADHGEVCVRDHADFLEALAAYKGGHPDYAEALVAYLEYTR